MSVFEHLTRGEERMDNTHYTKAQVLAAERASWAGSRGSSEAYYSYDGISFWRHLEDGGRQLMRENEAPAAGWHHDEDCNCGLCREVRAASESSERQALIA
jgi:hypothetical protein